MAPRGELPLFPDETDIARAVLGPGRVSEWKALAIVLERRGLPMKDPVFGARYWPAVRSWLDRRAGLHNHFVPSKVGGMERPNDKSTI